MASYPTHHVNRGQMAASHAKTGLEHDALLDIDSPPHTTRLTGIICTMGPACQSVDMITQLRRAGMNVCRLNFSHGSYEYHGQTVANIRQSCVDTPGAPIAIALDTKGPEIRTGENLEKGDIVVQAFSNVLITTDDQYKAANIATRIYVDYKNIAAVVSPGNSIYLDDGLLNLLVDHIDSEGVHTIAQNSATIASRRGVNLPHSKVDLPAVSEKDFADLRWAVEMGLDMVFASFIRKAADVHQVRGVLGAGSNIKIISKIENHEGMENFHEILAASDGIMVARGDLGIEIPTEKVFLAQKMMVANCNLVGKPVICATQMLESMIVNPRPTRAEASDVANAVLDGCDCVMLSGETAKGAYPVKCVEIMSRICLEAESATFYGSLYTELRSTAVTSGDFMNDILSSACSNACSNRRIACIIVLTRTGQSAYLMAKYRPPVPILTVTRNHQVARQCHLYRGLIPMLYDPEHKEDFQFDVDDRLEWAIAVARERGIISEGQIAIAIQGWKGGPGSTNTLRLLNWNFTKAGDY